MIHNEGTYLACIFVDVHGDAIGIDITDRHHIRADVMLNMTSRCLIADVTISARTASVGSLQEQSKIFETVKKKKKRNRRVKIEPTSVLIHSE